MSNIIGDRLEEDTVMLWCHLPYYVHYYRVRLGTVFVLPCLGGASPNFNKVISEFKSCLKTVLFLPSLLGKFNHRITERLRLAGTWMSFGPIPCSSRDT